MIFSGYEWHRWAHKSQRSYHEKYQQIKMLAAMEARPTSQNEYSGKLNVEWLCIRWMLFNVYNQRNTLDLFFISKGIQWKIYTNLNEIQWKNKKKLQWNEMKRKKRRSTRAYKTKTMIRLNDYHLYWWWFSCVLFCRLNIFVFHSNKKLCA